MCARLAGAVSFDDVMTILSEEMDRLLGWDCCYLVHRQPGRPELRIAYHIDTTSGRRKTFPGEERHEDELSEPLREALTGKPILINRRAGETEPRMIPVGTGRRSASLMFAPIFAREHVIGVFSIQSYTEGRYDEAALEFFTEFVNVVAPALEHVRAEGALQWSEERYRLLLEQSPTITYTYRAEPKGQPTYVSPQVEKLLGYRPEEFIEAPDLWERLLHPQDRERIVAEVQQSQASGKSLLTEYRMIARDGRVVWFQHSAVLVRDYEGGTAYWLGVAADMTPLRQAQELVRLQRDLGLVLSSTRCVSKALEQLIKTTMDIEGIDCGAVHLVEASSGELRLAVSAGLSPGFLKCFERFDRDTPEGKIAYGLLPRYLNREQLAAAGLACRTEDLTAIASIPVAHEGRLIAIVNLGSRTRKEIPLPARHAIEAIASQLGAALVRLRAEEALREANRNLEDRVEQRTAELREANTQLRREIERRIEAERQYELLALAVKKAAEPIAIWDSQWRLTYCNAAFLSLLGHSNESEVSGDPWTGFIDAEHSIPRDWVDTALDKEGRWEGGFRILRADGRSVPVTATLSRFQAAFGSPMIVGALRDESDEEDYLDQIRRLAADAQKRLEEERGRLARELHDELGQAVTALNMHLASLSRRAVSLEPMLRDQISSMDEIASRILESVRDLSRGVRSPAIDHLGTVEAVIAHAAEFRQRFGIPCTVQVQPREMQIRDTFGTTVFRIVQESLTNIARHSKATSCEVDLLLTDGILQIRVRDNGIGAGADALAGKSSLGLAGMRERVETLGGTLRIHSTPGKGVCITARLPAGEYCTPKTA